MTHRSAYQAADESASGSAPYPLEPQPGGRTPAPGELRLLQSFLNSRWNLEADHEEKLQTPAQLVRWLSGYGLLQPEVRLTAADLQRTWEVREGLRALLFVNNGEDPDRDAIEKLNAALRECGLSLQLGAVAPPRFIANRRTLNGALARIASIAAVAQIDGSWARMKACPGSDCGWAFYDHSRNQTGSWCSMARCGARAKAREYRQRKRQDDL